jgi:hypothetical protein
VSKPAPHSDSVRSPILEAALLVSSLYLVVSRLLVFPPLLARGERSKELEILVLRHELAVLHLVLNFCALWKKQTTLPSLAYAGIPYQVLGERAGGWP